MTYRKSKKGETYRQRRHLPYTDDDAGFVDPSVSIATGGLLLSESPALERNEEEILLFNILKFFLSYSLCAYYSLLNNGHLE